MSAPPEVSADGLFADIARVIWLNDHGAAERLTKAFRVPPARTLAGLHIHASTTHHTLAGALAEAVPSVAAAMPDDAFAGLAAAFIAEHPPRRAALHAWGDDLPEFLAQQGAPSELMGLAQLDRAALRAFFAADAEPITATAFAALLPHETLQARLTMHPSAQRLRVPPPGAKGWLTLAALPQVEHRWDDTADGSLVVMARPHAHLRLIVISRGTHAFLAAVMSGATLVDACEQALEEDGRFDPQAALGALLADGLFVDCTPRGAVQ